MKYLLPVAIVFLAISTILLSQNLKESPKVRAFESILNNLPVEEIKLSDETPLVDLSSITATSVYVFDLKSEREIASKNPDVKVSPASTTKMMTAYVASNFYNLNDIVRVGKVNAIGSKMDLIYGEVISVESLLYGLLVKSANDAAEVLASRFPGDSPREEFVGTMNIVANSLGMNSTNFVNPSGLDHPNQTTTAKDMYLLARRIIADKNLSKIVSTSDVTIYSSNPEQVRYLKNTNLLLGSVDGVKGVKTGWTEDSGENLVTWIERGGESYIISLFGSDNRFGETVEIVNQLFRAGS